jgi:hypothetical protein
MTALAGRKTTLRELRTRTDGVCLGCQDPLLVTVEPPKAMPPVASSEGPTSRLSVA